MDKQKVIEALNDLAVVYEMQADLGGSELESKYLRGKSAAYFELAAMIDVHGVEWLENEELRKNSSLCK